MSKTFNLDVRSEWRSGVLHAWNITFYARHEDDYSTALGVAACHTEEKLLFIQNTRLVF